MSKELEKVLESSSMAKGDGWKVMAKGDGWKVMAKGDGWK